DGVPRAAAAGTSTIARPPRPPAGRGRASPHTRPARRGANMTSDATMLRLRQANPVPEPVALDDADLFARITSLPRDHERRLRAPPHRRRATVLAIAVLAMALLASTAYAISSWVGGDVVKPDVTRLEYQQAQQQLTLPPGATWPQLNVPENSVTGRGAGGGHA